MPIYEEVAEGLREKVSEAWFRSVRLDCPCLDMEALYPNFDGYDADDGCKATGGRCRREECPFWYWVYEEKPRID